MLTLWYVRGRALLVVAIRMVLGQTTLLAQAVSGTISGMVTDPSGATIAGATVGVKNTATQVARTLTTIARGYTLPELMVHNCDVRISRGFQHGMPQRPSGTFRIRSSFGAGRSWGRVSFGVA